MRGRSAIGCQLPLLALVIVIHAVAPACAPSLLVPASEPRTVDGEKDSIEGKVVAVEEGDRVVILAKHLPLTIRLIGIDAPEKGQRYWKQAREFSAQLALGQEVSVRDYAIASTGEVSGHVFLPDGRCLNEEVLQAGFAWWVDSEVEDRTFGFIEREARLSARGLWEAPNPVAPWKWRKTRDRRGPTKPD
jgi:micrococcal nuclease